MSRYEFEVFRAPRAAVGFAGVGLAPIRAIRRTMTYEEAKAWFESNQGQMIESRGVATVTVSGRSVRFSSKVPEQDEFAKAISRLKRILT